MSKAPEFLSIVEATDMTVVNLTGKTIGVAKEILRQLGGNKFIAMTGAKNFGVTENSLNFKIGKNSSSANWVKVVLNGKDLYDVSFFQIRRHKIKTLKTYNDIYNDQLRDIFTDFTGLYTSLGTMGR